MKNFFLIIFFAGMFKLQAQSVPQKSVKFHMGFGIEYRLTPLKDVMEIPSSFINFEANLSGVPAKFWLAYHFKPNWHVGFKYCVRYDHTGIDNSVLNVDYQVLNSSFSLISDYVLYLQKLFPLGKSNKLSLKLGYAWMNQGVIASVFENNQFHLYHYDFNALNFEVNYHYKFFFLGVGIYYNPSETHKNYNGQMQILYFNLGFNVIKF